MRPEPNIFFPRKEASNNDPKQFFGYGYNNYCPLMSVSQKK